MADTEQGMTDETTTPEVFDSGSSSGAATDFPKVEPMNAAEDPALENFLPDPAEQTLPGEEKDS